MQILESVALPPRLLAALATQHASFARFDTIAAPRPGERSAARVRLTATHDIWLIRWGAGSSTLLHDHGGSAGALFVVEGELVEHRPNPTGSGPPLRRMFRPLDYRTMTPAHVHDIANESDTVAASVHVYSPPLETMHHFEMTPDSALRIVRQEVIDARPFTFE